MSLSYKSALKIAIQNQQISRKTSKLLIVSVEIKHYLKSNFSTKKKIYVRHRLWIRHPKTKWYLKKNTHLNYSKYLLYIFHLSYLWPPLVVNMKIAEIFRLLSVQCNYLYKCARVSTLISLSFIIFFYYFNSWQVHRDILFVIIFITREILICYILDWFA